MEKRKKQAQRVGKQVNGLHILVLECVKVISVNVQCSVKVRKAWQKTQVFMGLNLSNKLQTKL